MILYCDTSAIVMRYVREEHSDGVRRAWRKASRVASSEVAFSETVAALARRRRSGTSETRFTRRSGRGSGGTFARS